MTDPLAKNYIDSLPSIDDAKSYRPTHTFGPFLLRVDTETTRILDCRFQSEATGDTLLALQFFSHFVIGLTLEEFQTLSVSDLQKNAKAILEKNLEFAEKFQLCTI